MSFEKVRWMVALLAAGLALYIGYLIMGPSKELVALMIPAAALGFLGYRLVGKIYQSRAPGAQTLQPISKWDIIVIAGVTITVVILAFVVRPANGGVGKDDRPGLAPALPPPPTERETLVRYNADWRRNGWEPMPMSVVIPYDMRQEEDRSGPWVYTGINCALSKGGKVLAQFPQHTGANTFALILGDPTAEEFLWANERPFSISSWTSLYLRSEVKRTPNQAFKGFVRLTDPVDGALRLRTFRLANPGERLTWGKLPEKRQYAWDLYIRFAWIDGSELSQPELLEAQQPSVVIIRHPASDSGAYAQPQYTAEEILPDVVYTGDGEPELTVIAPNLPFPTRVEVILRIKPRQG